LRTESGAAAVTVTRGAFENMAMTSAITQRHACHAGRGLQNFFLGAGGSPAGRSPWKSRANERPDDKCRSGIYAPVGPPIIGHGGAVAVTGQVGVVLVVAVAAHDRSLVCDTSGVSGGQPV